MSHIVKCLYCGKQFDRDITPCQKVGNRYAHWECCIYKQAHTTQEDKDKMALEQYIMELFNEDFINPKVKKQISTYVEKYGYSYSGIRKALIYAFEIKKNDINKANNGIGIVPYVYKEAYNYYYAMWKAKQQNENKDINAFIPQKVEVSIINPQRTPMKKKKFSFIDDDEI